jgi:hypothetical protein
MPPLRAPAGSGIVIACLLSAFPVVDLLVDGDVRRQLVLVALIGVARAFASYVNSTRTRFNNYARRACRQRAVSGRRTTMIQWRPSSDCWELQRRIFPAGHTSKSGTD